MSKKRIIAVCGKGGVGKTAFTSMLCRIYSERTKGNLLVIDADPALGLYYALGKKSEKTIGSVRDAILQTASKGSREDMKALADKIDYLVAQSLEENESYSFLAMGRMDKVGCFCSVNDLLKEAIAHLTKGFDHILIDGEAGLEQINRQVVEDVDTLLILTDASRRGMQTVRHIKALVDEGLISNCTKCGIVFNRVQTDVSPLLKFAEEIGIKVMGYIPYDKEVEEYDLLGKLPSENPALCAVKDVFLKSIR